MLISEDTCKRPTRAGGRGVPEVLGPLARLIGQRPWRMLLPSLADLGSVGLWWDFQAKCHREGFVLGRPGGPLSVCSPECGLDGGAWMRRRRWWQGWCCARGRRD